MDRIEVKRKQTRSAEAWAHFRKDYERKVFSVTTFRAKRKLLLQEVLPGLVLDLGCGPMGLLVRDASMIPGVKVVATDFSLEMLLESRCKWQRANVHYLAADNRELPFRSQIADTIFSINSILPEDRLDVDLMFEEAHRILRTGGRLVAVLPAFEMSLVARDIWEMNVSVDLEGHREWDTTGWQCFFTEGDIADLMARHGVSNYCVRRLYFDSPEEITHIRTVYAAALGGVPAAKLEEYPLFEHLLVFEK